MPHYDAGWHLLGVLEESDKFLTDNKLILFSRNLINNMEFLYV